MPVRDPLRATAATLARANGPWEGWDETVELGGWGVLGPLPPRVCGPSVTDGWPPLWVSVATGSVVRRIRGVDSGARIKRHCGR